jgi:hypothetical protein
MRSYLADHSTENAAAAIDVAVRAWPENLEAWRAIASALEQAGIIDAISFRQRIVEQAPAEPRYRFELAWTALNFGDFALVADTLVTIPRDQRETPDGKRLLFALALANRHPAALFSLQHDIVATEPNPIKRHLLLTTIDLHNSDSTIAEAARIELERIAGSSRLALDAKRELWLDATMRGDKERSIRFAREIAVSPAALFGDRLAVTNTDLLYAGKNFEAVIQPLLRDAAVEANIQQFVQWLITIGQGAYAKIWLDSLSTPITHTPAFLTLKVDVTLETGDLKTAALLLHQQESENAPRPAVFDLAIAAHEASQNSSESRAQLWQKSLQIARGHLPSLRLLQRLSATWRWDAEFFAAISAISDQFPRQTWAHQARAELARRRKDTAALYNALCVWREATPQSERLEHDCALINLLRTQASPSLTDIQALVRLYESDPRNPFYAVSAALALALNEQTPAALQIANGLSEPMRAQAANAPYLAFIYSVGGDMEAARKYLAYCENLDLLPEEEQLASRVRIYLATSHQPLRLSPRRP